MIPGSFNHYLKSLRGQKHLDLINITFSTLHHALGLLNGGGNLYKSLLVSHLLYEHYKGCEPDQNQPVILRLLSESEEELKPRHGRKGKSGHLRR